MTFHHACGTISSDGKPCSMNLGLGLSENFTTFAELTELFNNGTLTNLTKWPWEDIKLPVISPDTILKFSANFDPILGSANLDNIHFYTQQK